MRDQNSPSLPNYIHQGQGPPVILVHGIAASLYDWSAMIPTLVQAGYQTLALDLIGHGESPKPKQASAYHIEAIFQSFETWIEHIHQTSGLVLVGHSLGGYLCLEYASRHPSAVRGLVLIDPFFSPVQLSPILRLLRQFPGVGARVIRWVPERLINWSIGWDTISRTNFPPLIRRQIAVDYKRASPNFVYITREVPDLLPRLPMVMPPTLVIWGTRDLTLQPQSFWHLVHMLPEAAAFPIDGCGHQPHIGKPELVNRQVLNFINALSSG